MIFIYDIFMIFIHLDGLGDCFDWTNSDGTWHEWKVRNLTQLELQRKSCVTCRLLVWEHFLNKQPDEPLEVVCDSVDMRWYYHWTSMDTRFLKASVTLPFVEAWPGFPWGLHWLMLEDSKLQQLAISVLSKCKTSFPFISRCQETEMPSGRAHLPKVFMELHNLSQDVRRKILLKSWECHVCRMFDIPFRSCLGCSPGHPGFTGRKTFPKRGWPTVVIYEKSLRPSINPLCSHRRP
jgi:hypothetical protein